jgi:hypothetical protein
MSIRFRLFFVLIGALLVAATYTFPYWQPLLTPANEEEAVGELLNIAPEFQPTFEALPFEQQAAYRSLPNPQIASLMANSALQPITPLADDIQALPSMNGPVVSAEGDFTRIDPIRWAAGKATIYTLADNNKVLRFENFSMVNGPDLRVILSANSQPTTIEEMMLNNLDLDLGALQGTLGSQNYNIPSSINIADYRSVVIFSRTLNLIYTVAPLRLF